MKQVSLQWNPDGGEAEWLRLIDFIYPGSRAVQEVIARAKAKAPNGEFPAYVPPAGWKGTIADLVNCQVEAIYETLRERGIGYAVERWDSRPPAQMIRSHEEVLDADGIGGPCLDLVLLMAACLAHVGIQPLVIVLEERESQKRHAILGYRLEELRYGPETPVDEIPPLLSEQELHELKNNGKVEFINCTGITRGENVDSNVDFEEAQTQGRNYVESSDPRKRDKYEEHWHLIFALDVKVARHTVLTREMQEYLKRVRDDALTLPPAFGFPPDRNFPQVRVRVQARSGRRPYSEAEERARELARRQFPAGPEEGTKIYKWRGSPDELEEEREEAARPLDWDRQVRDRLKRGVIRGDPGFGKTWLLKHEAWRLAQEGLELLEGYPLKTDEITLPIFIRLAELATIPGELDEAIINVLVKNYKIGPRLEEWFREQLQTERCRLLLDALDEVPVETDPARPELGHRNHLVQRLAAFARNSKCQIWLTSRIVGYPGPPIPLPPREGEYELLPFDRRQQRDFVEAWFAGRRALIEPFLRDLRANPQLQGLGQVPLLLALLCRTYEDKQGKLPLRRAELYESCLEGILRRKWKQPLPQLPEAYLDAKRELVEELAYRLFLEEKELFSVRDLRKAIKQILEKNPDLREDLKISKENPDFREDCKKSPAELVQELSEGDGLLIKAGAGDDAPYLFLHLTLQEYLTACALARRTEPVDLDGQQIPEWLKIVKPHLFDPRWEEVIRLLASKLPDATPLIQAIWREPEDLFLGRLFLAVKCLVDAGHVQQGMCREIIGEAMTLMERAVQRKRETLIEWSLEQQGVNFERLLGMLAAAYDEVFRKLLAMLEEGREE